MILVNIGCGAVYHSQWANLDFSPTAPEVMRYDARNRLPFADGSVDAVYHAHLLEHLESANARFFLTECHRVLRPGGVIRIAVPDLEAMAEAYLSELKKVRSGGNKTLYSWVRLEMIDQAARARSGGEMADFAARLSPQEVSVVKTRAGSEIEGILKMKQPRRRRITLAKIWLKGRLAFARLLVFVLGGRRMLAAFDEGWFRQGGEVHRVMYDQVFLGDLLQSVGFASPLKCTAFQSQIPDYATYELDATAGGIRKADSLFMEAVRL